MSNTYTDKDLIAMYRKAYMDGSYNHQPFTDEQVVKLAKIYNATLTKESTNEKACTNKH